MAITGVLSMSSLTATAATVQIDFGPQGSAVESGYSAVGGTVSSNTFTTTVGSLGVTLSAPGLGFFNRGSLTDSGLFTFADLYNDFAYTNQTYGNYGSAIRLTLTGLAANSTYYLRFFSSDNFPLDAGVSTSISTYYIPVTGTGATINSTFNYTLAPTSDTQYSATGSWTTNGAGTLEFDIEGRPNSSGFGRTRLNGLQLSTTPLDGSAVPAPGALTLLGLGLGALVFSQRRRPGLSA